MAGLKVDEERVLNAETKELWNILNSMRNSPDNDIKASDYEKVKYGINLLVPIWYFTEDWYEIYPNSKKVAIRGHGKFSLDAFMDEKEERDSVMRGIIIENMDDEGIITGRI